mgnify:CR=1 FL=1
MKAISSLLALLALAASPETRATDTTAGGAAAITISHWGSVPGAVVTWPGAPLAAGSTEVVMIGLQNSGYGEDNSPVTLVVDLPVGVTYRHIVNAIPGFNCTAQMQGDHQVVTCTTSYLYDGQNGFITLAFDAALDIAVPGPLAFHAAIGNDVQAPPSDCVADPHQTGCGRLTWATQAPLVAQPVFIESHHAPDHFPIGQAGEISLAFTNASSASATATTIALRLPAGFAFQTPSSTPALSCSVDGAAATGQIVTCQGAGLPAGMSGILVFHPMVGAETEVPGPVVVLAAIDQSNPPSTATLFACADDPSPSYCRWHEIPTYAPCASQYADGIYCDGFEPLLAPEAARDAAFTARSVRDASPPASPPRASRR